MTKLDIDVNKCRGHSFDSASVMSGVHSGVKIKILDIAPNVTYIYCNAHNLYCILVFSDIGKCITTVSKFFNTIKDIFYFF